MTLHNDPYWPGTPAPGAWRQDAACRGADPGLFFPEYTVGRGDGGDEARAVCQGCPVIEDCRAYADSQTVLYGIWAGEGEGARQRRRWRSSKQIRRFTQRDQKGIDVTEDEVTAIARGVQAVVQEVRRQMAGDDGLDRVGPYCPPELRYERERM